MNLQETAQRTAETYMELEGARGAYEEVQRRIESCAHAFEREYWYRVLNIIKEWYNG